MASRKKTKSNPHGLTAKQRAVISVAIDGVQKGNGLKLIEATEKIYDTSTRFGASSISSRNMKKDDFREALMEGLNQKNIIGANSKVEQRFVEGLDATTERAEVVDHDGKGRPIYEYVDDVDYNARLKFIQEINKITGVYAPIKSDSRKVNLNLDLTPEQLDQKIKNLNKELEGD